MVFHVLNGSITYILLERGHSQISFFLFSGHFGQFFLPLKASFLACCFLCGLMENSALKERVSWGFSIIYLFTYFKKYKNHLSVSTITAPSTIFTQGFATSGFLFEMHQSSLLVPALQSHVSMMVLGYVALLCGSLFSVAFVVITFQKALIVIIVQQLLEIRRVFGRRDCKLGGFYTFLWVSLALSIMGFVVLPM